MSIISGMVPTKEIINNVNAPYKDIELHSTITIVTTKKNKQQKVALLLSQKNTKNIKIEYIYPKQNRGKKIIAFNNNKWQFTPKIDRIKRMTTLEVPIQHSNLKLTDIIYKPMTEAMIIALSEGTLNETPCYIIKVKMSHKSLTERKVWIDKNKFVLLKEVIYEQDKVLQTTELLSSFTMNHYEYPAELKISYHNKNNDIAIINIEWHQDMSFNNNIWFDL